MPTHSFESSFLNYSCALGADHIIEIEGLTKDAGRSLLVSGETIKQLSNQEKYQFKIVPKQEIRGKLEGIEVYEVGVERM